MRKRFLEIRIPAINGLKKEHEIVCFDEISKNLIERLMAEGRITGEEKKDRETIYNETRDGKKYDILYAGNTVYYYKLSKELKKHLRTGKFVENDNYEYADRPSELRGFTDDCYNFCSDHDIAHYDKRGFIGFYGNDFRLFWKECVRSNSVGAMIPWWREDERLMLHDADGK